MTGDGDRTERIRRLNDKLREEGPTADGSGRWLLTRGVSGLGQTAVRQAVRAVQGFAVFNADNDPYGEHDFGAFEVAGRRLFWKIDYYSRDLVGGSPDPADASVTCRVLTILLVSEY